MLSKNFRILFVVIFSWFLIIPISSATETDEEGLSLSLVKIYTTANFYSYKSPWQAPTQQQQFGSGFIISKNRILTNAHVVSNHAFIEVRRANDATRYLADIEFIDHDCDLAILKPRDNSFFNKTVPLEFGTMPKTRDRVTVFGFPIGGDELSITAGIVSRVENQEYAHSGIKLLVYQIDAAINPGNSGGPVLSNNKVVGVAHQGYLAGQSIGYMIPVSIIEHFLKDTENKHYQGFPTLGVDIQSMENPDLRASLEMGSHQTGVRVASINALSSAKELLKEDDIILDIDNTPVSNDGTVLVNKNMRLSADYLISKAFLDNEIPIKVLRNKEIKTIRIPLRHRVGVDQLVPFEFDRSPTYYIFAGFIFQPLTQNFLQSFAAWGADWQSIAPKDLLYYLGQMKDNSKKQVILLNRVLADEINIGYQEMQNLIIKKVNGKDIATIQDVITAIEKHNGPYHMIVTNNNYKIILDKKKIEDSQLRIFKKYFIHSDRSSDLTDKTKTPVLVAG